MRPQGALVLHCALLLAACGQGEKKPIVLATTTSTQDSGLLDVLVPEFEKASRYRVKVIAVGTGEALKMGERGDADVLLVHAPKSEEDYMKQGFGGQRKAVMHNDFVLLGPASDPAGAKGGAIANAFAKIAEAKVTFVSRADRSGTHRKEQELWAAAKLTPAGQWYVEAGQGMGECLKIASEKKAYILSDRGTYLALKPTLALATLVEGDAKLFNPYHVITVNAQKHPKANSQGAQAFVEFLTGAAAQGIIREFGRARYGQPLFAPDAATH
ncbi:MAG TPA: substrate-binding domain-containing protein [Planctomycetota bacterium]|nr:substrate-binding domain-containing protein [Planctomycetota bacterium]HRR79064.1 substrate-binding domain-containing protein [Planctomycetota bacterium]HRT93014.1 substrate-binding domain-containing protein [Planctomycetota bacterium]